MRNALLPLMALIALLLGTHIQAQDVTNHCGGGVLQSMMGGSCGSPSTGDIPPTIMVPARAQTDNSCGSMSSRPTAAPQPAFEDLPDFSDEPLVQNATAKIRHGYSVDVDKPSIYKNQQGVVLQPAPAVTIGRPTVVRPVYPMYLATVYQVIPMRQTGPAAGTITTTKRLGLLGLRGTVTEQWNYQMPTGSTAPAVPVPVR